MGQPWENPNYGNERRRRLRLVLVPLVLAVIAASALWLLRRSATGDAASPAAADAPNRPRSVTRSVPELMTEAADDIPGDAGPASPLRDGEFNSGEDETRPAAAAAPGDDFAARKSQALSLYRENELEPALAEVQAALALRLDDELLELQAKLKKEIRVQRNYDAARTANFVVLFDGLEHDEMKYTVLDVLKSAYAEVGKELDYFPDQPISVILYTAKDFSDITRAPVWAGGMYGKLDGKIRVPVQGAAGQEQALRRVLTHEYTHALLHFLAPGCPLWLEEGLAQYFCGDEPVNAGQMIPLAMLADRFPSGARAALAAYMESLQAVTDLVEEHGMPRLRRLLDELGGGSGLETAFAAAYGQPFSRWAGQWRPVQREE